jgi:hypothetical protein
LLVPGIPSIVPFLYLSAKRTKKENRIGRSEIPRPASESGDKSLKRPISLIFINSSDFPDVGVILQAEEFEFPTFIIIDDEGDTLLPILGFLTNPFDDIPCFLKRPASRIPEQFLDCSNILSKYQHFPFPFLKKKKGKTYGPSNRISLGVQLALVIPLDGPIPFLARHIFFPFRPILNKTTKEERKKHERGQDR